MPEYRVYLDDELLCKTEWPSMAQAAWHRASRERNASQHGGQAVLVKDGLVLADVQPRMPQGHAWPDATAPEADMRDIVKAALQLLRHAGHDIRSVADQMTAQGLPTTRSRLDALKGSTPDKRAQVCAAEIVVLLNAACSLVRK